MLDSPLPPATGHVDAEGCLTAADPRLAELNRYAGGALGARIAIPELARLVRLAQRLGIVVSRRILAADTQVDLDLWVRAEPGTDGVRIAVHGWQERSDWNGAIPEPVRDTDYSRAGADWLWETDAALRVTLLSSENGARGVVDTAALLGRPLTELFTLAGGTGDDLPILGALAARERFEQQEAVLRATGQRVRLDGGVRIDGAGHFAGFIGTASAIEDNDKAEGEPADTTFSAAFGERLDKALRGPLGRIIANADSMQAEAEGPLGSDYTGYAADIASAGRHLLSLVEDLADLEAVERPDFVTEADAIDLADVARRAAGLLNVRAAEAGVDIDRPRADEMLPATGEFRRALQILVNLIGNAVRYSPEDGTVWIRMEREGDRACVIVADQGKGIAEADQVRIFEKFERVDTGEIGGSGLGLYIARRLARAMGGDIVVDSAPGQGARFVLTLPYRG